MSKTKQTPENINLRDWFAGQALIALVGNEQYVQHKEDWFAKTSYTIADAMLKARSEQ